jgi:hypothetical protein
MIDFSSILNDTIDGIIDTTVNTPITVNDSTNFEVVLYSCSCNGCDSPGAGTTIESVAIVTPEPSGICLLAAGLALLLIKRAL